MTSNLSTWSDTIVALATAPGISAIAVIRLSGENAFTIAGALFPSKNLSKQQSHRLHVGLLKADDKPIDEVVISIFKSPHSYTGEDIIEISCHGSPFIQQKIITACIAKGARLAKPGEFTQRAFLNGKLDLTQAEAVADLIASNTEAAQRTALNNIRGGFSVELKSMREQLIQFASLIELELDFAEEDVAFADREKFYDLLEEIASSVKNLIMSFVLGNVIKNGVSVAIVGLPNVGKSTLLNALLNEERAIVSDIPGTTRDTIEESMNINGVMFRLIDTAGIRKHSADVIENLGMERSRQNAEKANLVIHLRDMTSANGQDISWLTTYKDKVIEVNNKYDAWSDELNKEGLMVDLAAGIYISAKDGDGIERLKEIIYEKAVGATVLNENTVITNTRHLAALNQVQQSLLNIRSGLDAKLSGDLLAADIRTCLYHLGEITGEITNEDMLDFIFSKFCIGK